MRYLASDSDCRLTSESGITDAFIVIGWYHFTRAVHTTVAFTCVLSLCTESSVIIYQQWSVTMAAIPSLHNSKPSTVGTAVAPLILLPSFLLGNEQCTELSTKMGRRSFEWNYPPWVTQSYYSFLGLGMALVSLILIFTHQGGIYTCSSACRPHKWHHFGSCDLDSYWSLTHSCLLRNHQDTGRHNRQWSRGTCHHSYRYLVHT